MKRAAIAYLAILFAASLAPVAAPSDGAQREYPPSVAVAGAGLHRGASHDAPGSLSLPVAAMPSAQPMSVRTGTPEPTGEVGTALIGGYATWYDACARCAAAGPALRSMLGSSWRGSVVTVEGPAGASVTVRLSDWCACGERNGLPTLLDLSRHAFAQLAHPSAGIVAVSIEIPARLPETDTR